MSLFNSPKNVNQLCEELSENPLNIFTITAEICENDGRQPSDSITEKCRDELTKIDLASFSGLRSELEYCLLCRDVDHGLQWLLEIGAIEQILPEVAAMATLDSTSVCGAKPLHKNVWEHTKTVVRQSVRRPTVRWAALFHDIGKVPTRTITDTGVHFHGHAHVGAQMFEAISKRINFPAKIAESIQFLILQHLRAADYSEEWSDSAVRRFYNEMGDQLTNLLDLSRADITSKRPGRRKELLVKIANLQMRIESLKEKDTVKYPLPPQMGRSLMEHFSLPPSPQIGRLKTDLENAIAEGKIEGFRSPDYYLQWIKEQKLL